MAEAIRTQSSYARRLLARKRFGGPEFRSLGNPVPGTEKFLPLPRPFHFDYFPNRAIKNTYGMIKEALITLLPFESPQVIAKYRNDNASR